VSTIDVLSHILEDDRWLIEQLHTHIRGTRQPRPGRRRLRAGPQRRGARAGRAGGSPSASPARGSAGDTE
jgi:hypothetical protein